jgi:DNA-binding response OmpR family regulator
MEKILLLDDSSSNRFTLSVLLEDEGFQVDAAASLAEARALLSPGTASYALALVDLRLGDGSGATLIPLFRSACPGAKVIIMSGAPAPDDALEAQVDAWFVKGAQAMGLVTVIRAVLGRGD